MVDVIWVKPHNMEAAALAATEATIRALPGGGEFLRDSSGDVMLRGGWVPVNVRDSDFIMKAVVTQGYVAETRRSHPFVE